MGAYFITFSTYGHYLPGQPGFIDRHHNLFGSPLPTPRPALLHYVERQIDQPKYLLSHGDREMVLAAIIEVCEHKGWELIASHVRTNHVHVVVEGDVKPERMMNAFKSYASRSLKAKHVWARHGSTRYLWTRKNVDQAVTYTLESQGDTMATFAVADHSQAPCRRS